MPWASGLGAGKNLMPEYPNGDSSVPWEFFGVSVTVQLRAKKPGICHPQYSLQGGSGGRLLLSTKMRSSGSDFGGQLRQSEACALRLRKQDQDREPFGQFPKTVR